jgi:hypothetical protein
MGPQDIASKETIDRIYLNGGSSKRRTGRTNESSILLLEGLYGNIRK